MNSSRAPWPAIAAASRRDDARRVDFFIDTHRVGSVARAHVDALVMMDEALKARADRIELTAAPAERNGTLARLNHTLRNAGLIIGWRDEPYGVVELTQLRTLATIERAASRFWGTLTFGAHCNGYVADASGRPSHLWIARRARTKATDPGKLDNLIGGGVPAGQTPFDTLVREGAEEAGLEAALTRTAHVGRVVRIRRDIPEGLQHEWLQVYDLVLPAHVQPRNQDGEVESFECVPIEHALALAASDEMTVDASLVTLDFALRHGLLQEDADMAAVLSDDAKFLQRL